MSYLGIHGLDASLDIIERAGVENIEGHVLRLTDLLIEKVQKKGYCVLSSLHPDERSGIVSVRDGAIRASAHLYNNEEDIERLVEALP